MSETEHHFTRRLEAFSDIVIGFSLAQLGASLTVPQNGAELIQHPGWFFGSVFAFSVVCSMWFFHHQLFSSYFVPTPAAVVMNFVWLGVVIFTVYITEVYVRLPTDETVLRMYFASYGLAYGLLGLQWVMASRYMKEPMPEVKFRMRRGYAYMFVWAVPFAISFLAVTVLPLGDAASLTIMFSFVAAGIAFWIIASRYEREGTALEKSS